MKPLQLGILVFLMSNVACSGAPPPSEASATTEEPLMAARHVRIAQRVTQTNLVSDRAGLAATTDPNLVNAWGISFNPRGPAWVSNNGTGTSTVYSSAGALLLTVTVPPPAGAPAGATATPTGQVFNATADFGGDRFIFATEDGTVSGWQPATGAGAVLRVDRSGAGAIYKGIALGASRLYVTNFHAGRVEVYDASYAPTTVAGHFVDPFLPRGFAPFNVFVDGGRVFVAYARQDSTRHDDVKGAGLGYVSLFDTEGRFERRLVSRGALNAPWGLAIAPATYGKLGGRLLVGNFGDGRINVYELEDHGRGCVEVEHEGVLGDASGAPLAIDGLWGLAFSPDADRNRLYFAAGPEDEAHGLYGRLDAPPAGDD